MIVLGIGDKIQGYADVASEVDYTLNGIKDNTFSQLADGQFTATINDLYTAISNDVIKTIIIVNTGTSVRTINLFYLKDGSIARRIIPKDLKLAAGYSLHTDGEKFNVVDLGGKVITGYTATSHGNESHTSTFITGADVTTNETDPVFSEWKNNMIGFGTKQTGVDAGILGQESIDDDYLYKCVVEGVVGVAVWKRSVLFQT